MATILDQLIDQAVARDAQARQAAEMEAARTAARAQEQAVRELRDAVEEELTPALRAALDLSFAFHPDYRGSAQRGAEASFEDQGVHYDLALEHTYQGPHWTLHSQDPYRASTIPLGALQAELPRILGAARAERRDCEERMRSVEAERARLEAEEAERTARLNAHEATLRARIASERTQAHAALWRWPAGVEIVFYRVEWCTGVARGEDGDPVVTLDSGYVRRDDTELPGYVRFEEERTLYGSLRPARTLRLVPDMHLPVFARTVVGSVDQLPTSLTETVRIPIPRVRRYWDHVELDRDDPSYDTVRQPVAWVRELVERAAEMADLDVRR